MEAVGKQNRLVENTAISAFFRNLEGENAFPHRRDGDFQTLLYRLLRREEDETTVQRRAGIPERSTGPK